MRELPLSNCEQNFINKSIQEATRLDGRKLLEARPFKIHFGSQWGCCLVSLGQTRVLAQVSCDIQPPKPARPNEGMLYINVELNPLAAPYFDNNRQSDIAILLNKLLEKCFKDSKCIDLESLCIVVDKKVWNLRVDINIINHDGNLIDCASIATLAALAHFHRPDVTSTGDEILIHPFSEKDPLPLTLFHHPLCMSYMIYETGDVGIDPNHLEEKIGVAHLTIGVNSYRELCCLDFSYTTKTFIITDAISAVLNHSANYASQLIKQIKETVNNDIKARYEKLDNNTNRFRNCISKDKLTTMITDRISIRLNRWNPEFGDDDNMEESMESTEEEKERVDIVKVGEGTADLIINKVKEFLSVGEGSSNTWKVSESSSEEDIEMITVVQPQKNIIDPIELSGDSEEEETTIIERKDLM